MLDLKDNLTRSLQYAKEDKFSEGIKLILQQLEKILEGEKVSPLKISKEFNPLENEAVAFSKGKQNEILETIQEGYKLHDKIIRPAKVKLGQEK